MNNILLNEFEKTQLIDLSKMKCEVCKENDLSNTFNNKFYKCIKCGINICPLCKSSHDKSHNIINYELINYICQSHNEIFTKYCNKCKKNICLICENEHKGHNNISYGEIMPNDNKLNEYMKELRKSIDILKNNVGEIKNELNKIIDKVIDNMEIFYNISNDIINYEIKNRNYEILQNIKEINNNNIVEEINEIINDNDIKNKINNIITIYNKMVNKDLSEINIIYDIRKRNKDIEKGDVDAINIFGSKFVENNKKFCKMIIDDKEYELKENIILKIIGIINQKLN